MLPRKRGVPVLRIAVALLVVILTCSPRSWPGKAASAATGPIWRIAGARTINLGGQYDGILSMSPNGQWLAVLHYPFTICLYTVGTLRQTHCASAHRIGDMDPSSAVWSPDSTHLAFTENIQYGVNCDIWVLDVATGALRDLTPDGAPLNFLSPKYKGPKALMDLAPSWSPDGKMLIFARSVVGGHDTSLYRIPVSGGTPTRVVVIASEPYALNQGLRWLADGRILYTLSYSNPQDARSGLWLLGAGGGQPRQLLKPDPTVGYPELMQVGADSRTALVWYPKDNTATENSSAYAVVDLASGLAHRLGSPPSARQPALGPWFASLSPDGAWLFCIYPGEFRAQPLAIRSVRSGEESPLRPQRDGGFWSRMSDEGVVLDWVGDSTVYLSIDDTRGLLLTLRRGA